MRFAYADPPYLGCGQLYAARHSDALAWDDLGTHRQLIDRLTRDPAPVPGTQPTLPGLEAA